MPPSKKRGAAAIAEDHSPALPAAQAPAPLETLENALTTLSAAHKAALAAAGAQAEKERAALASQLAAQAALLGALREENARLCARLAAEGGPARLPPALITASSLYAARAAEAGAGQAAAAAACAQASASAAQAALALAALKAFTALELAPLRGAGAGAGGLEGVFACRTLEPLSQRAVAFTLDFYSAEGAALVEYMPGEGTDLLPPFLQVRGAGARGAPPARRLPSARALTHTPPPHTHAPHARLPSPLHWIKRPCSCARSLARCAA